MTEAKPAEVLRAKARAHIEQSLVVKQALLDQCLEAIVSMGESIAAALANGKRLYIFGNGGSAADSQHMAAELVVRLTSKFERPAIPALALTTDSSLLTACANDYSFEKVFSRSLEAFGQAGDVALGISTSGNSGNVIEAFKVAKDKGMHCALLSGESGGKLRGFADSAVLVPSTVTAHIQECHITAIHILCDIIERKNHGKGQDV